MKALTDMDFWEAQTEINKNNAKTLESIYETLKRFDKELAKLEEKVNELGSNSDESRL